MNLSEFQHKISETGKPVVVDFWATWCMPCKMTEPILEKLAREYAEKVDFLPIDADDSREVLEKFKILGIPTVLALSKGKEVGRITGAQSEAGYRTMFEALAAGTDITIPISLFDRLLRFFAGALIAGVGLFTSNLFVVGIGGIIAFLGIYDRCPVWTTLIRLIRRS